MDANKYPQVLSRRVLVVDDNLDAAESLALLLRATRHDVRTTTEGPAALEVARTFRPEIVLLDLGMPVMDGREVARRLRQEPTAVHALIVAVTGYEEEDLTKSGAQDFDAWLTKPVDLEALQNLLARGPIRA
jgi:CheY-like chemotaxis protein